VADKLISKILLYPLLLARIMVPILTVQPLSKHLNARGAHVHAVACHLVSIYPRKLKLSETIKSK